MDYFVIAYAVKVSKMALPHFRLYFYVLDDEILKLTNFF